MHGFIITDAAAVIADREGVTLTSEQAEVLRRRVDELDAEIRSAADFWGMDHHEIARHRLEDLRQAQGVERRLMQLIQPNCVELQGTESAQRGPAESGPS